MGPTRPSPRLLAVMRPAPGDHAKVGSVRTRRVRKEEKGITQQRGAYAPPARAFPLKKLVCAKCKYDFCKCQQGRFPQAGGPPLRLCFLQRRGAEDSCSPGLPSHLRRFSLKYKTWLGIRRMHKSQAG